GKGRGTLEGDGKEEAESTDDLVEQAPGDALGQEVELEVADLLGAQEIGGTAKVPGEARDGSDVGLDGMRGVVTEAEVIEQALTQRSHGTPCRQKEKAKWKETTPTERCARVEPGASQCNRQAWKCTEGYSGEDGQAEAIGDASQAATAKRFSSTGSVTRTARHQSSHSYTLTNMNNHLFKNTRLCTTSWMSDRNPWFFSRDFTTRCSTTSRSANWTSAPVA